MLTQLTDEMAECLEELAESFLTSERKLRELRAQLQQDPSNLSVVERVVRETPSIVNAPPCSDSMTRFMDASTNTEFVLGAMERFAARNRQ